MHRQACAIILTRGDGPQLEVYLTLRSMKLAFMAGFHAFPGGTMSAVDAQVQVNGASDALPADHVSCAARELFEECGIVLGGPLAKSRSKDDRRRALLTSDTVWKELVDRGEVVLDAKAFRPFGRWVTPPFAKMRFDARYLQLDAGEAEPIIWPGELDSGFWMPPAKAIEAHDIGAIFLSFPVLETLRALVRYGDIATTSEALTAQDVYPHPGGEMLTGIHAMALASDTIPPATHTNVYILGGKELVVVDPAPSDRDEQQSLVRYIEQIGAPLKEVWLTHHHPDHVGAVQVLRDHFNVPVAGHAQTAEHIPVDRLIKDGETTVMHLRSGHTAEWVAMHTPGHARGHLCFFEKRLKTLICGDLMASVGTIIVAPPDGDMADYMTSLKKVRALNPRLLFPAHGPPVAAVAKIDEYIAHREARERAILAALPSTPADIVPKVYTDVSPAIYPLAEVNVRAHLDKLVREQRVIRDGDTFAKL